MKNEIRWLVMIAVGGLIGALISEALGRWLGPRRNLLIWTTLVILAIISLALFNFVS